MGDDDTNLNYARWHHEQSTMPALPSRFQGNSSWDIILHSYHFKQNGFSNMNGNCIIPGPTFYRMNALLMPGATFGVEEMPKPQGTGTYFPKNRTPSPKSLTAKGRDQGTARPTHNNWHAAIPMEAKLQDRSSHELSHARFSDQGNEKAGDSDFSKPGSLGGKVHPGIDGLPLCSEGVVEFGSVRHIPFGLPLPESRRQLNHASLLAQNSIQSLPTPGMQKSKPVLGMNQNRVLAKSSYRLKDEDDFPPLSV